MFDAKRASMLAFLIFGAASWLISQAGLAHAGEQGPVVFKEEGKASYYGDEFQGQKTATGERFDQNQLTAAHPTLPLGSEVTVTNPDNGRKVDVEVNDRGPYVDGRNIDLSKQAAKKLGITQQGVADVEIEATKTQVEQAIDRPKEAKKVENQLKAARSNAAQDGTPQPAPLPALAPPAQPQTAGQ